MSRAILWGKELRTADAVRGGALRDVCLVLRLNRYLGGGKYFVCISIVKSDRNLVV